MSKIQKLPHLSMFDEITVQFQRQSLSPIPTWSHPNLATKLHTIPVSVDAFIIILFFLYLCFYFSFLSCLSFICLAMLLHECGKLSLFPPNLYICKSL